MAAHISTMAIGELIILLESVIYKGYGYFDVLMVLH